MDSQRLRDKLRDDEYFCTSWDSITSLSQTIGKLHTSSAPICLQRSVTQRISEIRQPHGGYLPIKLFTEYKLADDGLVLKYNSSDDSKRFASMMGLVVDYVSRYLFSKDIFKSFDISFLSIIEYLTKPNYTTNSFSENECLSLYNDFKQKLFSIEQLNIDIDSRNNIDIIKNIFIIVQLDSIYRAGYEAEELWKKSSSGIKLIFNKNQEIPDYICNNALTCIRRAISFYKTQKNITFGECFGNGELISTGDCDFISHDTIWDMKVSSTNIYKNSKVNKWTLQILIYYLMLKHPTHHNFSKYISVKNVGIFNPFFNVYYLLDISKFTNSDYIKEIEEEIIGFNWNLAKGYRFDDSKMMPIIQYLLLKDCLNIKIYSRYNKE